MDRVGVILNRCSEAYTWEGTIYLMMFKNGVRCVIVVSGPRSAPWQRVILGQRSSMMLYVAMLPQPWPNTRPTDPN